MKTLRKFPSHLRTVAVSHVDFGLVDKRGRSIGARVTVRAATVVEEPTIQMFVVEFDRFPTGTTVHFLQVQPTRAGKPFGAGQDARLMGDASDPDTHTRTQGERARRINAMRKRYAAKVAKGAV